MLSAPDAAPRLTARILVSGDTMTAYEERKGDRDTADRQIVEEAEANGFMACRAIRDGLGYDQPGPNGNYYSSMGVAYRWLRDAGEEVVYLIPDGITDVTKSERTGCYPDAFARVLAYKEAHTERRRHAEWESRRNAAQQIVDYYAKTGVPRERWLMNPDMAFDNVGPEPVWDDAVLLSVDRRKAAKAEEEEVGILEAMREYDGPMNKRGTYPKGPFMGLRGKAKRELWDRRND